MSLPRAARLFLVLFVPALFMPHAGAAEPETLAQLEAKVAAQEAIRAAKRLQNAYAQYLSEGLWNEAAELFTDDARAVFAPGAAPVVGKNAIRAHFMAQAGRSAQGLAEGQLHSVLNYQPIVNLADDGNVKGTWHELVMLGKYGKSAEWRGGVYENEYQLDDGAWKISNLRYFPQYSGDYDAYGHTAPPAWNIPYHFEAAHVGLTLPPAAVAALQPAVDAARAQRTTELGRRVRADAGDVKITDDDIAMMFASMQLAQVARRIQAMADESAVQNLQHAFGYYLDRKMYEDAADLFVEAGSIEIGRSGVYKGRKHVLALLETLYGPARLRNGELFEHINLGTVVTIAPDGATAQSRTTQLSQLGRNGEYARWELGTYENSYINDNGVWKLAALRYFPRMGTDYDLGWAADAQPASLTQTTTWDRAPTHTYESYPRAHVVAFHYPHPVSGLPPQYPDTYVALRPETSSEIISARTGAVLQDMTLATPERIAALAQRLDAAIAVDAVENLMSSYGYYIDESAWDEMAATYASKGSKEITGVGVYVGPERIREILNRRGPRGGRTPNFFTIHQLVQPVIHVSADNSYANARMRLFQSGGNADGSSGSWIGGIYENSAYFKNGEWKFGRQDLHHLFSASYRNGWARVGSSAAAVADENSPGSGPEGRAFRGGGITQGLGGAASPNQFAADYPPDGPIRARQYAFPEITTTAFHYNNPVSGRAPAELLP